MRYKIVCTYKYLHLEPLVSVILKNIYILYLFINIGIIIFVSFILKKIKMIFIAIYLSCCKIPREYSSNSSNIRFPEQKMLENDSMETARTEVTSIRHRNDIEKSTWRTHRYLLLIYLLLFMKFISLNRL